MSSEPTWQTDENGQSRLLAGEPPRCPVCASRLDGASSLEGTHAPRPGDLTICLVCTSLCQYSDTHNVQLLPQPVFDSLPTQQKIQIHNAAYACAAGYKVDKPTIKIAYHMGWYGLVIYPDLEGTKNLVYRAGPYESREALDKIERESRPPRAMLFVGIRKEPKNKMFGWFAYLEVPALGAKVPVEASPAKFYTLEMAKRASHAESLRLARRYGIGLEGAAIIEIDPHKTPPEQRS